MTSADRSARQLAYWRSILTMKYDISDFAGDTGYHYLATPYSKYHGGLEAAFVRTCEVCAELLRAGINAYAPIAHTHPIATHGKIDPLDHGIWLPFDAPMMEGAKGLIVAMIEGWQDSFGIGEEIKYFRAAEKPVYFLDVSTMQYGNEP